LAEDSSLGAAVRRLPLQRGLSREDFPVSAKTLARIERGETTPPPNGSTSFNGRHIRQARTLAAACAAIRKSRPNFAIPSFQPSATASPGVEPTQTRNPAAVRPVPGQGATKRRLGDPAAVRRLARGLRGAAHDAGLFQAPRGVDQHQRST
jgi:hypothetical protein